MSEIQHVYFLKKKKRKKTAAPLELIILYNIPVLLTEMKCNCIQQFQPYRALSIRLRVQIHFLLPVNMKIKVE